MGEEDVTTEDLHERVVQLEATSQEANQHLATRISTALNRIDDLSERIERVEERLDAASEDA